MCCVFQLGNMALHAMFSTKSSFSTRRIKKVKKHKNFFKFTKRGLQVFRCYMEICAYVPQYSMYTLT